MPGNKPLELTDLLAQAEAVEAAARQAVRQALLVHKRMGNPICVWRHGRVVWIPPEEITIPAEIAEHFQAGPNLSARLPN
jgi:hypothetical protein